jgi:hypothetical protein
MDQDMAQKASITTGSDAEADRLSVLGHAMLAEAAAEGWPQAGFPADTDLSVGTLAMKDLISDANGEIRLCPDSGQRVLALETDAPLVDEGTAEHHVMAMGDDVSGHHYMSFANGITVYYPEGLHLLVLGEPA